MKSLIILNLLVWSQPWSTSASRGQDLVFPTRTNDDSALLEWGHSAVIHAADAIVSRFGLQTSDEEFELGIEASPVFGKPSQGCEPLRNPSEVSSQMVFLFRGACDFATKARNAVKAGAVALVVINHDHTRPDHAFAMMTPTVDGTIDGTFGDERALSDEETTWTSKERDWVNPLIPCVMISWNSGQAIVEDRPERLRLYPGGGRPFIESVNDESPVVFIIHNLLTSEERSYLKDVARTRLRESREEDEDVRLSRTKGGRGPVVTRRFNTTVLHRGLWKSALHKEIDEKLFSIINFPPEYYADLQVNKFIQGGMHGAHYDSDRYPSTYRERVMTVVFCLDSIPEEGGGDFVFPKAKLRIRPQAGMAIVYHNTIEDGSLDPKSSHADEELLSGIKWTATQKIFARPVPVAARTIIPGLVFLLGGETPAWMFRYRAWAMDTFGDDTGFELFNNSFFCLIPLAITPLLLLIHLIFNAKRRKVALSGSTKPKVK